MLCNCCYVQVARAELQSGISIWWLICHTRIKPSTEHCALCTLLRPLAALPCTNQSHENQTLHTTQDSLHCTKLERSLHLKLHCTVRRLQWTVSGDTFPLRCWLRQKWSHSNVFNLFQLFFLWRNGGWRLLWKHKKGVGDVIWAKSELEKCDSLKIVFTIESVIANVQFKKIIFAVLCFCVKNLEKKEMVLKKGIGRSSIGQIWIGDLWYSPNT